MKTPPKEASPAIGPGETGIRSGNAALIILCGHIGGLHVA